MNVTVEMPTVATCSVDKCAYNVDSSCHAKAITIGDRINPNCDTFLDGSSGHTHSAIVAGVGACKVSNCEYNDDFECMADSIKVALSGDMANCLTYKAH